jgi:hypothetical protein
MKLGPLAGHSLHSCGSVPIFIFFQMFFLGEKIAPKLFYIFFFPDVFFWGKNRFKFENVQRAM